jgi:very-short-patch-repair endonuclease
MHVSEALLNSELAGGPSPDSRARVTLRQHAHDCARTLRKMGLSEDGAICEVRKAIKSNPLAMCDSPIEQMMMASLLFGDWRPFKTIPAVILAPGQRVVPKGDFIVAPQYKMGAYRLDFLIIGKDDFGNQKWVNVECDGEEHHHTSIAQYEADRERDKYMRAWNIDVIRFHGSEIWKEPAACAHEAATVLIDWLRGQQLQQQAFAKLPRPI